MADDNDLPPGPIVAGIGASAGGIEALSAFFDAAPSNLAVTCVVILQLASDHR